MQRFLILFVFIIGATTNIVAQDDVATISITDSKEYIDTKVVSDTAKSKKKTFFRRIGHGITKGLKATINFLNPEADTNYIKPQEFNFQVMAQASGTFDHFLVSYNDQYSLKMSPKTPINFGPYGGWRWLFFGYTFNVNALNLVKHKIDINTSVYTPALAIDFVYRDIGANYRMRSMSLGKSDVTNLVEGMPVDGLGINIMSLNVFHSLNSRHYSHQAAFYQSSKQLISAGSWIVGLGYNNAKVTMNWEAFQNKLNQYTNNDSRIQVSDTAQLYNTVKYKSIPLSVGYGYNWVLAKNLILAAQLSGSLSYMWSQGFSTTKNPDYKQKSHEFNINNFTMDGTMRMGIVWTNERMFAGASAIYHTYHYHKEGLNMFNIFGTVNLYVGFNFWRRKPYRYKGFW